MYFDRYSITSLRYIDISFKNLFGTNLAVASFIYLRVSVAAGRIRPAYVSSVSIFFYPFPTSAVPVLFSLRFRWECKGKNLF
jgi:hypothetical protein